MHHRLFILLLTGVLLIGIMSLVSAKTESETAKKQTSVQQQPDSSGQVKEVSGPKEITKDEYAGQSVELPQSNPVQQQSSRQDSILTSEPSSDSSPKTENVPDAKTYSDQISKVVGQSEIEAIRQEARALKEQADQLFKKADEFEESADNIEEEIEELEDLADDFEDQSAELLKQAGVLQTCIRISDEKKENDADSAHQMPVDSSASEHQDLMLKMRNSADELLTKAKEISVKVREMKESSGEKEELSDKFQEKAEELENKADELEQTAEQLEDQLNMPDRFRLRIGHQIRFSSVPPTDDKNPHVLILSGLQASWFIKPFLSIGAEDITIRIAETLYGARVALGGSPVLSYSYFPIKRLEIGAGLGAAIQGQVGADRKYNVAVAPFIKIFNETWVADRFSLGPVVKCNVVANGDFVSRVLPSDRSRILPVRAVWFDFGITYSFHF